MAKRSAGMLMYRRREPGVEVFLAHPGGPYWVNKDMGAWTIPKGEYLDGEDPLEAAKREFQEETGFPAEGVFVPLGEVKQPNGKLVTAWAFEGDCDPSKLTSNTCLVDWPPRSGRQLEIPEVDRGEWFTVAEAGERIMKGQRPFLDRLMKHLSC